MQRQFIILIALICLGTLQYRLWFGSGGIVDNNRLYTQLDERRSANQQLLTYNLKLASDIARWRKGDPAVIEAYARRNLGMIKHNELFYQLAGADVL